MQLRAFYAACRAWGRVRTMLLGGINFLIGAVLTCAAQNLAMLIVGRIILGFGVGACLATSNSVNSWVQLCYNSPMLA